jgi:hypothetical protein
MPSRPVAYCSQSSRLLVRTPTYPRVCRFIAALRR